MHISFTKNIHIDVWRYAYLLLLSHIPLFVVKLAKPVGYYDSILDHVGSNM